MSNPLLQADTASTQSLPPPGLVEKVSLERYVPPRKPSLVGLSRAELADAFAAIGVPAAQRKMRVQQLWQWLYVRGARHFDEMTSVSKELRAQLDARYTLARPEVVAPAPASRSATERRPRGLKPGTNPRFTRR